MTSTGGSVPIASRALALFEAALALPHAQRRQWIEARSDDDAVRAGALALLAAHAASAGFLEPAVEAAFVPAARELGPYRLLEPLGSGGMGQVWLAERRDGAFEQRVAIKVLASSLGDPESIRRAESERQFLAWLEHPHIAHVLDGGTTTQGQPYVVMEYVAGERIDAWCRAHGLDVRARIVLFLQVLSAVDAAHRALIIHRDIKPANVLVNADGDAKLLDFGIAKSLDGRVAGQTHTGLLPLTPEYASPEQLLGQPLTTASDVYSLGLMLDELLTGRAIYGGLGPAERVQRVAGETPTRPSARIDAEALGLPPRARADWKKRVSGDLDRVVLKALEAEPRRRYESARAFADDLERWLDHRPVHAHPASAGYRAAKFVQRNRWAVAATSLAVCAVAAGSVAAMHQAWRANQAAERAQRANQFLIGIVNYSDPRVSGKPVLLVDALDHAAAEIQVQLSGQPELEGDIRQALGEAYIGLERTDVAHQQLARAALLRAPAGGNDYAATLDTQAMLDWRLDDTDGAERKLRQALANCTNDSSGQAQRASILSDYAGLLGGVGRFGEALPMAEEAVRLQERLADVAPANRAISWGNLASARYGNGQLDAARDAYAHSAQLLQSIVPPPELDISINLNNQARLLSKLGRTAEALPLQERSIALKRKVMGTDYSQLVWPLAHLAEYYSASGRHGEAAEAIRESLRLAPGLLAPGDAKFGDLHASAAQIALAAGDTQAAVQAAERATASYAKAENVDAERREHAERLLAQARASLAERDERR